MSLPRHWNEQALWEHGLQQGSACFQALNEIVTHLQRLLGPQHARKAKVVPWAAWAADAIALVLCILESSVRDCWVLFSDITKRRRLSGEPAAVCAAPSDVLSSDQLEDMLGRKVNSDGWPKIGLRSALKWLKPVLPAPLCNYSMREISYPKKKVIRHGWRIY